MNTVLLVNTSADYCYILYIYYIYVLYYILYILVLISWYPGNTSLQQLSVYLVN